MIGRVAGVLMLWFTILLVNFHVSSGNLLRCDELNIGQYFCDEPVIDLKTQAEVGCQPNRTVLVECHVASGINCTGVKLSTNSTGFYQQVPCRYVNGKSLNTALLLSIFLGMFGVDRFYLGYPAIGLFKFCTFGFFMIFQFIDVLLIASQVLKPADGSDYVMDYFGHRLIHVTGTEDMYWLPL